MKIEKNSVVSLSYHLQAESPEGGVFEVETVNAEQPLVFIFGSSGFPEKFEDNLEGLDEGQEFNFKLSSDDAYGPKDEQAVVRLPKDIFMENGTFDASRFTEGSMVPMSDADGNVMPARILEVGDQDMLLDFNHPLAGLALDFAGVVTQVRKATKEEIEHGHVHGPGGHHH